MFHDSPRNSAMVSRNVTPLRRRVRRLGVPFVKKLCQRPSHLRALIYVSIEDVHVSKQASAMLKLDQ